VACRAAERRNGTKKEAPARLGLPGPLSRRVLMTSSIQTARVWNHRDTTLWCFRAGAAARGVAAARADSARVLAAGAGQSFIKP
jgi:hypothetical protein